MADKIINSFQQRRQLAQEIEALAETSSELELLEAVRTLVQRYPPELLLTALLKHLDTPSSELRGGLGHLAALLPPDQVAPALRNAAANRQNRPEARLTAALLLERFLGESVPQALLSDLQDTNEVAFQSLREAIDEGRQNRHILLEYVTQMRQTGEDVAAMVLGLLARIPPVDRVELLRLIAQDDRPRVAAQALSHLEALGRDPAAGEQALRALYTLQYTLPPELAQQAERSLRKLQFAGRRYTPPTPDGWQALMSPADASGSQSIWFVFQAAEGKPGQILGVVINGQHGVLDSFGSPQLPPELMPARRSVGQLVSVQVDRGQTLVLLTCPFDYARWRVQEALSAHWQGEQPALPGEYRLYNDWIWQFAPPQVPEELRAYFVTEVEPEPPADPARLAAEAAALLEHPAMAGWIVQNRALLQAVRFQESDREKGVEALTRLVLQEIEKRGATDTIQSAMAEALRAQAAWLHLAGNQEQAQRAWRLVRPVRTLPPSQNPLLAQMVAASIRLQQ
ncbi:hypothetical protein RY27_22940 [Litorilinea aerophila]|nr:hypothetical protein RY27_22940 [Litorilinea aerophila]